MSKNASDFVSVKIGVQSPPDPIKPADKFSSAMGPRTKPITKGAKGIFLVSKKSPSSPKLIITQTSNMRFDIAKEPTTQNVKMMGNKNARGILVSQASARIEQHMMTAIARLAKRQVKMIV